MKRRTFLTALGGAAAWPLAGRAQQPSIPVIGFLSSASPRAFAHLVAAFREGLEAQGYTVGRDIWIDYRWAEGHYNELPALAADFVRRKAVLIAATGGVVSAQAAREATSTIPIVFVVGYDPVQLGLVSSMNEPGGNATGVSLFTTELAIKRLELFHDLVPGTGTVAILVNPGSVTTDIEIRDATIAAQKLGIKLVVIEATSDGDLERAFELAVEQKARATLVSADPFFTSRRTRLVALADQHRLPGVYPFGAYVDAGGLMSYGTELPWAYRQAGVYAGRILKGARPAQLPVMLPTNFDLVINLKAAKSLGVTVSPLMLARAHRVVE